MTEYLQKVGRPKARTVSLHYKRRRADVVAETLSQAMAWAGDRHGTLAGSDVRRVARQEWLRKSGFPAWTLGFEVRRARTRFHYKVVAVSG